MPVVNSRNVQFSTDHGYEAWRPSPMQITDQVESNGGSKWNAISQDGNCSTVVAACTCKNTNFSWMPKHLHSTPPYFTLRGGGGAWGYGWPRMAGPLRPTKGRGQPPARPTGPLQHACGVVTRCSLVLVCSKVRTAMRLANHQPFTQAIRVGLSVGLALYQLKILL